MGTNEKFDGSIDLNWRKGKFNSFAGISGRSDRRFFQGFSRPGRARSATPRSAAVSTSTATGCAESVSFRTGTEYAISERGVVGLQGNLQLQEGRSNNDRTTQFFDSEGALFATQLREETEPSEENEYEVRANYSQRFAKEGRKLEVAAQYSGEVEQETENYAETFTPVFGPVTNLLQSAPADETENQFLGQADYEQTLGDLKFEAGWRSTVTRLTTDAAFGDVFGGEFRKIDSLSNVF